MRIIVNNAKNAVVFLCALFAPVVANTLDAASCQENTPVAGLVLAGLEHTRPEVVRRELLHAPGKPYHALDWQAEKRRLESLDLFALVELSCHQDTLLYAFTELFQYFPSPAGKKTDQDGWMLGGALAHLNAFGRDIRVEGQFRATVVPWMDAKEYALYASSPWLLNWPLDWNFELLRTDSWDGLRGYFDRSWALWTDLRYPLSTHWNLLATGGGRRLDHADAMPGLGGGLLWDSRDARLDTRRGLYEEFRVTRYGGPLGGADDFVEYLWDGRHYYSLGDHVWSLGALVRWRPGTQSFTERLHQGGANTLRGFDPDSAVHGRHEALLNAEYRHVLVERSHFALWGFDAFWGLQAVAGADGAFLWDKTAPDWAHYRSAAYAGLHLVIPALDRLRCEVGYSPDARDWIIAVGLFEKNVTQRWRTR